MYRVFLSRLFPHETRQSIFSRFKFFFRRRDGLLFLVSNLFETRESIISRLKFARNERVYYFLSRAHLVALAVSENSLQVSRAMY